MVDGLGYMAASAATNRLMPVADRPKNSYRPNCTDSTNLPERASRMAAKKTSEGEKYGGKYMELREEARFEMRTTVGFMKAIDNWRRRQEDLPNRSEAVRRLVELGLKSKGE
jgi:hypothetical protein